MLWKSIEVGELKGHRGCPQLISESLPLVPLVFQWNEMKLGPLLETGDAGCNISVHLLICKYMPPHYKYAAPLCRQSIIWPIIRIIAIIHEPPGPRAQCQATRRLEDLMATWCQNLCIDNNQMGNKFLKLWSNWDTFQLSSWYTLGFVHNAKTTCSDIILKLGWNCHTSYIILYWEGRCITAEVGLYFHKILKIASVFFLAKN